ncbi:hypothetical protein C1884_20230 [Pseudomonas sp. GW460-R15]|nr:hypothetical protein C1887_10945 [Pseudomonas sp. GW456-R21]POA64703.1 hypothetical protein C1884_20230 [Pseudomonas sp. GW460-R15]
MSRSLGLREDQLQGEWLAMQIAGLFTLERGDVLIGKPRSLRSAGAAKPSARSPASTAADLLRHTRR